MKPTLQTPPAETLKLSEFLPFRLSVLTNTISRRIAERYDREFGLNIWQWRVMAVIGETPGMTASQVTERTAMDKVAVSRAVTGLVELGYLERRADTADGRRVNLHLTGEGQLTYERIVPLAKTYEAELLASVPDKDAQTLMALLDEFARVVSPDRPLW